MQEEQEEKAWREDGRGRGLVLQGEEVGREGRRGLLQEHAGRERAEVDRRERERGLGVLWTCFWSAKPIMFMFISPEPHQFQQKSFLRRARTCYTTLTHWHTKPAENSSKQSSVNLTSSGTQVR